MHLAIWLLTTITIAGNAGTTGFEFLRITPTAREAALAGSALARPVGALAFYYNPAGINPVNSAQFTYINHIAGTHLGSVAYTQPLDAQKTIGAGVYYFNSGTMKRTNEIGEELGTFGVSFASINLAGNINLLPGFALGLGISGLYGTMDTFFSLGLAGNLGILYQPPVTGLNLAFAVNNLGVQLKPYGTARDPLPLEFNLGASWEPIPEINLNLTLNQPIDNRFNFRLGIEGWVNQFLALRLGYNSLGTDLMGGEGSDALAGFATGIGVRYDRFYLDYSFTPMVILGTSHRISLGITL